MTVNKALGCLAELDGYLLGCALRAKKDKNTREQFERWRRAVGVCREALIEWQPEVHVITAEDVKKINPPRIPDGAMLLGSRKVKAKEEAERDAQD